MPEPRVEEHVGVPVGPLSGVRLIEMTGLGPAPFCAMLLAGMGAEVVRIGRKGTDAHPLSVEALERDRPTLALDLKAPEITEAALALIARADILIEGFRPGVMERLNLGPEACLARNPRLVYGRMTGWGQTGPLAHTAGHDLNYIALSGALAAIGPAARPAIPLNLIGDYGGGALYLALGVVSALVAARATGRGHIVDAAMVDGAASLMSPTYALFAEGKWQNARCANPLDGGAHFYNTYACRDGKWLAVAPIEPAFYREFLQLLEIDDPAFAAQWERDRWPELRRKLADVFLTRTRDEWCALFAGSDACVAPVLDLAEAPHHPHNRARGTFAQNQAAFMPSAAPRFSSAPAPAPAPPDARDLRGLLADWGLAETHIAALL